MRFDCDVRGMISFKEGLSSVANMYYEELRIAYGLIIILFVLSFLIQDRYNVITNILLLNEWLNQQIVIDLKILRFFIFDIWAEQQLRNTLIFCVIEQKPFISIFSKI